MTGRSIIVPWFKPDDYEFIRGLIQNDPNLPDTYDEWLKLATEQNAQFMARGDRPQMVIVNTREFSRYCQAGGDSQLTLCVPSEQRVMIN